MRQTTPPAALALACVVLAGCGSSTAGAGGSRGPAPRAALPALASRPAAKGEILASGQASPSTQGPFTFSGRYLVRFEQFAPENAKLDFTTQTPFTATLTRSEGDSAGAITLFEHAGSSGQRQLDIHGRYYVEVAFGDYPYALRFTPRG
ncbi:MAG: hypothetical protein ACR2KV_08070 [Solirubrobacteraceae bacterium]